MIELKDIGKRFRYEWIFKNITHTFENGKSYAVLGPNGSGKSTLMKILSGHLTPSAGEITFYNNGKKRDGETIYHLVSYAAPYIDLIEELTLTEIIAFHSKFKPLSRNLSGSTETAKINSLIDILNFQKSRNKEIRFFSSGMKQRLKLALAICSETPILLLDEPTTNLDAQGVEWYQNLIKTFVLDTPTHDRLVIVASNIEHDYLFCDEKLDILGYK
jgi:ABC-type multidrug transport system ATPase subunit